MRFIVLGLIAAAFSLLPMDAAAQRLAAGAWKGTVTGPNSQEFAVAVDISHSGDSTFAKLHIPAQEAQYPLQNLKVAADTVTFSFGPGAPGPLLNCRLLRRDDGAYQGTCEDPYRPGTATFFIRPPADE